MSSFWCATALLGEQGSPTISQRVRVEASDGLITAITPDVAPDPQDQVLDGVVVPAAANAHSHAFHRTLRGRTHHGGGDFWVWREQMYRSAAHLSPQRYEQLATAVFAEMVVAGFSSVAEFHYVHHQPDGTPYPQPHAMELALARAATAAGIRLTLLDTLYLAGGIHAPLSAQQKRFGDADVHAWLDRLHDLRAEVAKAFDPAMVAVGAALHSVRGVPETDLETAAHRLPAQIPVHIHLSEQPAENQACLQAYGLTPTALLARHGLLSPRLSAVHATHLSEDDIALLGGSEVTVVMCPTTEADLADGIGPATALAKAGATIALGTDQHAVIDPWLEMRGLEHGERLSSGRRGRFSPGQLLHAATAGATRSMATPVAPDTVRVGSVCDLVCVNSTSARTAGSLPDQLPLTATAGDVTTVVIGGKTVAADGKHVGLGDPGELLSTALEDFS